jgi:hypothetical protein
LRIGWIVHKERASNVEIVFASDVITTQSWPLCIHAMPYDMLETRFPQLLIGSAHNDVEWFSTADGEAKKRKLFSCTSKCLVYVHAYATHATLFTPSVQIKIKRILFSAYFFL